MSVKLVTPDDRANANRAYLNSAIALEKRYEPLGLALKYERERKTWANALVIASSVAPPSVAQFISDQSKISASSNEVNANDLMPLLEEIASKRNAETIYELIVNKFSAEGIKYLILYWKAIKKEMYETFSNKGNVHPNDIFDYLFKRVDVKMSKNFGQTPSAVDLTTEKALPAEVKPEPTISDSLARQKMEEFEKAEKANKKLLKKQRRKQKPVATPRVPVATSPVPVVTPVAPVAPAAPPAPPAAVQGESSASSSSAVEIGKEEVAGILQRHNVNITGLRDDYHYKVVNNVLQVITKSGKDSDKTKEIMNEANQHKINWNLVVNTTGTGIKRVYKKNITFRELRGTGCCEEPVLKKEFVRLNKFMVSLHDLEKGLLKLKYVSNSNIPVTCPITSVNDAVKEIILGLCKDEFYKSKFDALSSADRKTIIRFCDTCHIDINESDSENIKATYDVLLGEYRSGHTEALKKLKLFLSECISEHRMPIKKGLKLLSELD